VDAVMEMLHRKLAGGAAKSADNLIAATV
jgi:hypothetical protein